MTRYITTSVSKVFLELDFVLKNKQTKKPTKFGLIFHTASLRRFAVMMCGLLYRTVVTIRLAFMVLVGGKNQKLSSPPASQLRHGNCVLASCNTLKKLRVGI